MKRKALIVALAALVLLGGWCAARRLFADDEAAIRAAIEDMRLAAEAKDLERFMSHVSSDYRDDSGHSEFILRKVVSMVIMPLDSLKVRIEGLEVMVTGSSAYATMSVSTEATKRGKLISPFGSGDAPQRPRVTLTREGSQWRIIKVDDVSGSYGE